MEVGEGVQMEPKILDGAASSPRMKFLFITGISVVKGLSVRSEGRLTSGVFPAPSPNTGLLGDPALKVHGDSRFQFYFSLLLE